MPWLLFEIRQCICVRNNSITNLFLDNHKFIIHSIVKLYNYHNLIVYYYKFESFLLVYLL